MFNREEIAEWRANPLTQEFYKELTNAAASALGTIMNRVTPDQNADIYLKGMYRAFDEMAAWKPPIIVSDTGEDWEGEDA